MRFAVPVVVIVLATFPAAASEPGQPLDCSDWVFSEPGFWCEEYGAPANAWCDDFPGADGVDGVIDTEGRFLRIASSDFAFHRLPGSRQTMGGSPIRWNRPGEPRLHCYEM